MEKRYKVTLRDGTESLSAVYAASGPLEALAKAAATFDLSEAATIEIEEAAP